MPSRHADNTEHQPGAIFDNRGLRKEDAPAGVSQHKTDSSGGDCHSVYACLYWGRIWFLASKVTVPLIPSDTFESATVRESSVHGLAGSTTSSFLDSLKQRDDEAWRRLASVYARLVLDWCRTAGVPSEERNDVCQEVFRAVAVSIDGFQFNPPDGTFRGWLRTIAHNKIVDHFRRQNRHPDAIGGTDAQQRLMAIPDEASGSLPEATDREKAIVVRQTLELIRMEFEDRTWQAFWRTAVEDQQSGLVAESLGMTPGAVRQAKSRVLHRLREELRQLMESEFFNPKEVRDSYSLCGKE